MMKLYFHILKGDFFWNKKGYEIISITCDGLPGLVNVFKDGIPVQFCHFHEAQDCSKICNRKSKIDSRT